MDNRRKKLMLLVVLLIGCLITSLINSSEDLMPLGKERHKELDKESISRGGEKSGAMFKGKHKNNEKNKNKEELIILIQVNGAVNCPGTYLLPKESRVEEAITMAGGFKEAANTERVNLAKVLKDGAMVYVPYKKQSSSDSNKSKGRLVAKAGSGAKADGKVVEEKLQVNLNRATQQELEAIPGIGVAMAQRIIAHRQIKSYSQIEELLEIRGIGKAKLERIRPYVTL